MTHAFIRTKVLEENSNREFSYRAKNRLLFVGGEIGHAPDPKLLRFFRVKPCTQSWGWSLNHTHTHPHPHPHTHTHIHTHPHPHPHPHTHTHIHTPTHTHTHTPTPTHTHTPPPTHTHTPPWLETLSGVPAKCFKRTKIFCQIFHLYSHVTATHRYNTESCCRAAKFFEMIIVFLWSDSNFYSSTANIYIAFVNFLL